MDKRQWLVIGLALVTLTYLGCASKSGNKSLFSKKESAGSSVSKPAPFNDPRYQELVNKVEKAGGTATLPNESDSTMNKIGSAVKRASSSVVSAVTLKPKVVKAADPVSLSSVPQSINADVYYQAGRLAESTGRREAAAKQYTVALDKDPDHLLSLISLARLHDRENEFAEAQRLYRKAIKVAPDNAMAYNDLGLCLARNDQDKDSIEALRQAISLEPDRKLYRNNLATVLVDMGKVDEAWNELIGAHSPAVAHYNLGYLLLQNGDKQQANHHFSLAYEKDPSLTEARDMLAQSSPQPAPTAPTARPTRKVRLRVEDLVAGNEMSGPSAAPSAAMMASAASVTAANPCTGRVEDRTAAAIGATARTGPDELARPSFTLNRCRPDRVPGAHHVRDHGTIGC